MTEQSGSTDERRRADTDPRGEALSHRSLRPQRRRRHPAARVLPFVIMAAIGLLIAREEVPAVGEWWERTFFAADWKAGNTCREAVLKDVGRGRYARVLRPGKVHRTQDGPYVDGLRVAVLDETGADKVVEYTCYLDNAGQLFRLVEKSREKPSSP